MIRLKTKKLIEEMYDETPTPLAFAYDVGISMPTARGLLANDGVRDGRGHVTFDVLDKLCVFFGVQPEALLEHVPDKPKRKRAQS